MRCAAVAATTRRTLVRVDRHRIARGLLGAREAARVQIRDRIAQRRLRLLVARTRTIRGDAPRHQPDVAHDAHQRIDDDEQHDDADHEQVQRHVDTVRRIDEQHLPRVEAADGGECRGDREQDREPDDPRSVIVTPGS
jgi:hypothetical protein